MSNNKNKMKKKKTIYIDDGRKIADMSYMGSNSGSFYQGSGFREKLRTYFDSVKLMLLPMLVTLGLVSLSFLILYLLISLA